MPLSLIDVLVLVLLVWLILSVCGAPVGYRVGNPIGIVLAILLLLVLFRGPIGLRRGAAPAAPKPERIEALAHCGRTFPRASVASMVFSAHCLA